MRHARWVSFLLAGALSMGACGESRDEGARDSPGEAKSFDAPVPADAKAYPILVSSEIVVGRNRFLAGLLNDEDAPIGSPDVDMRIDFYDLEQTADRPESSLDMDFVWIHRPVRGIYVGEATFDRAGKWGAEVHISGDGLDETVRTSFEVLKRGATPALGDVPPASDTPTAADVPNLSKITTDPNPAPRFYRMSIADALKAGRPSVVVFATPKFCVSQTCGPTLDIVKDVASEFPGANFVHVEPFDLSRLPEEFVPVAAATEWGLPGEPWVFVMDAQGRVAAKFEGVLSRGELRAALQEARGP